MCYASRMEYQRYWVRNSVVNAAILTLLMPMVCGEVFIVDTNKTMITISGSTIGSAFKEQGVGSMTTHYSGQLAASLEGSTIQFMEASTLTAMDSGSWEPKADGSDGKEPANYGATVSIPFSTGKAALRKVSLNAFSPPATITDGQFDSSGLVFAFPTNSVSSFAYRVSGLMAQSGSFILTGYATNKVTTLGSLKTEGNEQVLTIPVDTQFLFKLVSDGDTVVKLKGELVATRTTLAPLVVKSLTVQTQVVTLQWTGIPNQAYQVEASPDLGSWQKKATNIVFPTSDYSWSGPATEAKEFFRVGR